MHLWHKRNSICCQTYCSNALRTDCSLFPTYLERSSGPCEKICCLFQPQWKLDKKLAFFVSSKKVKSYLLIEKNINNPVSVILATVVDKNLRELFKFQEFPSENSNVLQKYQD